MPLTLDDVHTVLPKYLSMSTPRFSTFRRRRAMTKVNVRLYCDAVVRSSGGGARTGMNSVKLHYMHPSTTHPTLTWWGTG